MIFRQMSQYRDPLAGLRSQIATKRGLLESRERSLAPLLRALLPEVLQARLEAGRGQATSEAESLEGLTAADAALDELLAAHEAAQDELPRLRECPDDVPDPRRPAVSPPWIIEESAQLVFRAAFTKRLVEIAPEADVIRWDDTTYLSRTRVGGMPVIVSSKIGQATFQSRLRTSVPETTPELEVRRERIIDGIGRAVGLVRDALVGDEVFDAAFVVDGSDVTSALLGLDVRRGLLALERFAPRLHLRRGVAELEWSDLDRHRREDLIPDAAFAVVLGIRAAIERA